MGHSLLRSLALAAASGAVLGACADAPPTGVPSASLRPAGPSANVAQATIRTLTVCAKGPAGTYSYSLSIDKNGSLTTTATPYGDTFTLAADECKDVVLLGVGGYTSGNGGDPPTLVTLTQTSGPANTLLDFLVKTEMDQFQEACLESTDAMCGIDTKETGPSTVIGINVYHGSIVSFWNSVEPYHTTGCTLTQGYWKTHPESWPAPYSPNATFFSSGKTWLQILDTPPKGGNAYLILAHQWIAATLNGASGASIPADVDGAYDNGTTYLTSGTGADPKGWAAILDAYNNGLATDGPGHCE